MEKAITTLCELVDSGIIDEARASPVISCLKTGRIRYQNDEGYGACVSDCGLKVQKNFSYGVCALDSGQPEKVFREYLIDIGKDQIAKAGKGVIRKATVNLVMELGLNSPLLMKQLEAARNGNGNGFSQLGKCLGSMDQFRVPLGYFASEKSMLFRCAWGKDACALGYSIREIPATKLCAYRG
jgi:hypothetical protein